MASGYDLTNKHPSTLMRGRLGIYDKRPVEPSQVDPELWGVLDQAKQLRFNGGNK